MLSFYLWQFFSSLSLVSYSVTLFLEFLCQFIADCYVSEMLQIYGKLVSSTTSPSFLRADNQRGAAELTTLVENEGEWSNCFIINLP